MEITLLWSQPLPLKDGHRQFLIYTLDDNDLEELSEGPGVYVFGRRHGDTLSPLYIGQAANIARRIE